MSKRHQPRAIPAIRAPGLTIVQHEGGGYTIAYAETTIAGHGPSLDAAWKQYKRSVDDFNAQNPARVAEGGA